MQADLRAHLKIMVLTRRGVDTTKPQQAAAESESGITTLSAAVNCLNGSVGVGVLGLPFAFKTCGWSALVIVTFVGAVTYYTATVIVRVLAAATGKGKDTRRSELNYADVGAAAFGRSGRLLSGAVQLGELGLAAVAIMCLLGDNIVQLSGGALSPTQAVLVASAVSFLLSVTKPDLLAYFSLLSLAVVVLQARTL